MKREPILIVERDANDRARLVQILADCGYDVYGAGANKLVAAVMQTDFPVVLIDSQGREADLAKLAHSVHKRRADTAIILTGPEPDPKRLIEGVRSGAIDYIAKPYNEAEVRERVFAAVERRKRVLLRSQNRMPTGALPSVAELSPRTRALLSGIQDFHSQVVEVFLEIEQRNVELDQRIAQLERLAGERSAPRPLTVMVAHSDPTFFYQIEEALKDGGCHILPQAFTGGETLERIGVNPIDVVFLEADLPDIPGQMVATSVNSGDGFVSALVVSGWGTTDIAISRTGSQAPNKLATPETAKAVLRKIVAEHRDREGAFRLAQQFKAKHQDFIRRITEIRNRINETLSGS